MATARFRIQEHTLPTSHIREYPRSTAEGQEDVLHLAIKQYTPIEYSLSDEHGVTIIGAHANGFPKELYEPLWDELYDRLKAKNIRIRSIWIADVAHQGQSGVLNENLLGNDPSWMDHPRDLFLMINHFRQHMKRPIVGVGHSMGGNNLVNLSLMHPRLFTTLILIDPVIQKTINATGNFKPAKASTVRRDRWPSRKAAEAAFKRSKFYQTWDPRVLDKWLAHGLRELPTLLYPEVSTPSTLPTVSADVSTTTVHPDKDSDRELTLKTTRDQEVFSFLRPNFRTAEYPSPSREPNPTTHPDVDTMNPPSSPFYRPEPLHVFNRLPNVRPSVLYVFGEKSDLSAPVLQEERLAQTGIGVGGSGGVAQGRVKAVTLPNVGHLIPMETVGGTADTCAGWMVPELERWRALEDAERKAWAEVPKPLRSRMGEQFKAVMMGDWVTEVPAELEVSKGSKL